MERIDVSPVGFYLALGHECFCYHPRAAADLVRLISTGEGATEQPGLRLDVRDGVVYWEVPPTGDGLRAAPLRPGLRGPKE